MERKHILVVGSDREREAMLQRLHGGDECRFDALFERDEVRGVDEFSVGRWLDEARHRVDTADAPPFGAICYWDFPVTEMTAILTAERGMSTPSIECIVDIHHKYVARTLQQAAAPEAVPPFEAVDVYDDEAVSNISLPYPFWLKPVRSFRSQLAFHVHSRRDLQEAVAQLRHGLPRLALPYDEMLRDVAMPEAAAGIGGHWCIAEGDASGYQCTLEGWRHGSETEVYGAVDSVREPNRSSFTRYQYPSQLPADVQARMTQYAVRCIEQTRCSDIAFNVEFFWDPESDAIRLLEINARCSASHFDLFEFVDGVSNAQVALDLALRRRPQMPHREGEWPMAAKCFIRRFRDAMVGRLPSPADVERIEHEMPGTRVHFRVKEGDRLSALRDQDPYSFELGHVIVGGADVPEIEAKFRECERRLGIELIEAAA